LAIDGKTLFNTEVTFQDSDDVRLGTKFTLKDVIVAATQLIHTDVGFQYAFRVLLSSSQREIKGIVLTYVVKV